MAADENAPYEVLMSAALLRELLMGDPPLMDLANRERRLKLRFEIARKPAYRDAVLASKPSFYSCGDGLDPGTQVLPGATTLRLGRDKLLREPVMYVEGALVTVRDLIDFVANAAGAIHYDNSRKKGQRALIAAADGFEIGGFPAAVKSLAAVGRIVVAGLDPLVTRIESEQ